MVLRRWPWCIYFGRLVGFNSAADLFALNTVAVHAYSGLLTGAKTYDNECQVVEK